MSKLGMLGSFIDQSYPPASKFTEDDVPDLSGKVIIVTGGNTGIGKETARVVLAHNAKVYLACRSEEKANSAIVDLKKATGKEDVHFLPLDLSSFSSIKKAAEDFKSKEAKLHVLFNNAGLMSPPIDQLTQEGYDMTFGTNVVGPYLFTTLLLPVLLATAAETGEARIVNTSSLGHMAAPKPCISWETLGPFDNAPEGDKKRRKLGPDVLYYQSKCGTILVANEWAKRYGNKGIISSSCHPGTIHSELGRNWPTLQRISMAMFIKLRPTALGAITQLYAGTTPDAKELNGKYLIPWARIGKAREDVTDEKLGEKLYSWLEEQIAPTLQTPSAS